MKEPTPKIQASALKILFVLLLTAFTAANVAADVVYVTSRALHGPGPNDDGTYADNGFGNDSTAMSTAPGAPPRNVPGVTIGPYTNVIGPGNRFYRLKN